MTQHTGAVGDGPLADDDRNGLVRQQLSGIAASGEGGVIRQYGAGADQDGVGQRALLVHPLPRCGPGDPLAGAVGCRGATIERRRPLHAHPRAPGALGVQPLPHPLLRLAGEHTRLDLDARGAEPLGAAGGLGSRIGNREHDLRHACLAEGDAARSRSAPVVAGLEGHDRRRARRGSRREFRQCIHLGVRGARARCQPSEMISPSGARMTQPTCGFTPHAGPCEASERAWRIACSISVIRAPYGSGTPGLHVERVISERRTRVLPLFRTESADLTITAHNRRCWNSTSSTASGVLP